MDDFCSSCDFVAARFQSAYRWGPYPHTLGCGSGRTGYQLVGRPTQFDLAEKQCKFWDREVQVNLLAPLLL